MDRRSFLLSAAIAIATPATAWSQARSFVRRLLSTTPGSPARDLAFLIPLLRGRTVIGLGEATHGSHELFGIKVRLVEFLANSDLVGTVAFELGFADGLALDRYVTHMSDDDPVQLLKSIKTFSVSVVEIADLLRRLRKLNASRPSRSMIRLRGYDIQTPGREAAWLQARLAQNASEVKIMLGEHLQKLATQRDQPIQAFSPASAGPIKADLDQLNSALQENRIALEAASSTSEFADMVQAATVVRQAFDLFASPSIEVAYDQRDAFGAANIKDWQIRDRRPVAVWAHNGHINKGSFEFADARLLGGRLLDLLGQRYYAIATAFFEGDVRAKHANEGVVVNHLPSARSGSIDAFLNTQEPDIYFVDLAAARSDSRWKHVIETKSVMRGVGGGYEPEVDERTYRPTLLAQQFDAVIFVRHVTASIPL